MDKKKEIKKGSDSHTFMDKILTKLKMSKHGEDKCTGSGKRRESVSPSCTDKKSLISWDNCKITPDNIMEFSDQLHQLLEYVQTLKDVLYYTYDYPSTLNEKLEREAVELRNLFRDVRAAAIDIERLQKQRHLVKKEKCLATKKLDKLREDEIRELESIICAYAKPLHSKWETIKNTQKAEVVENFMNEVTGKHRAIEILQELVRRKLSKLTRKTPPTPFTLKKNITSSNVNIKIKTQEKNTSNWNITTFPDVDKFNQSVDKAIRGVDRDILKVNRRKRQRELREERRRQNADTNTSSSNNNNEESGGLDLQLVPIDNFTAEEVDDVITTAKATTTTSLSTRTPPIVSIDCASDDDTVSMSSSDFTIENFVQGGGSEIQSDLQNEMRTVLQALFGEIRHIPQIGGFSTRNRHNNSGNDLRSPRTASH